MATRRLYSTPGRPVQVRNTQQLNRVVRDAEQLQDSLTAFLTAEKLTTTSYSLPNKALSKETLRRARVSKYQESYDQDKEQYKIIMQEKERKKLMQKLERYKGVGELGFKLSDDNIRKEENDMQLRKSRDHFQHIQDSASRAAEQLQGSIMPINNTETLMVASFNSSLPDKALSKATLRRARVGKYQELYDQDKEQFKIKEQEKEHNKLMQKLERYKGVGELGFKLTEGNTTEEENNVLFLKSRDRFQHSLDSASMHVLKEEEVQVSPSMNSPEGSSSLDVLKEKCKFPHL